MVLSPLRGAPKNVIHSLKTASRPSPCPCLVWDVTSRPKLRRLSGTHRLGCSLQASTASPVWFPSTPVVRLRDLSA